jgi:methionyl-tRNA formyltransferase
MADSPMADSPAADSPVVPPLRLVFAGTPEAALPSLRRLLTSSPHQVVAVLTRPPAPTGRGKKLTESPVALLAHEHGIPVLAPPKVNEPGFLAQLRDLAPDCCPIVAYGALIGREALTIPRLGWVNLHFSLLPAWRGAAPVQHAVLAGDQITGASTFQLEQGLDTGPVFGVVTQAIGPADTSGDLLARLADSGADLLEATLNGLASGQVVGRPQPPEGISLAPKLSLEDARLDWKQPALAVDRRIRACTPAPGAWTTRRSPEGVQRLKLGPVSFDAPTQDTQVPTSLAPGRLHVEKKAVWVGTGTQPVRLSWMQPPGRAPMPATDWARGAHPDFDERWGDE